MQYRARARRGWPPAAALCAVAMAAAACGPAVVRDGTSMTVPAGGDLQAALDAARPGDTITLEAGATYAGTFTLPAKDGSAYITIRSSALAHLPEGERVSPASAVHMPKIIGTKAGQPAIRTAPGAHHYRLAGLEIAPAPGVQLFELVSLGHGDQAALADVPHHLAIDRCYLHGQPGEPLKRIVGLNSAETTIEASYLAGAHTPGQDSQAIAGWSGPGPFRILNNYLEGAGENVIFGGANPRIRDLVPSDIEVRGNHVAKPAAWRGGPWSVKNLFELKSARRVDVEGNVFERNWLDAQNGFAILYNCVDDSGWARIEDVTFAYNVVRHSGSGVNLSGSNPRVGCTMANLAFRHNVWVDIDGRTWGGDGRLFQVLNAPPGLVVEHNTAMQSGNVLSLGGTPGAPFVFRHNIAPHNQYGIIGDGAGIGRRAIDQYAPGSDVSGNVLFGLPADVAPGFYPPGNAFPAGLAAVGFTNVEAGDFSLGPSSPFRAPPSGVVPGADVAALAARIAAAVSGRPVR